VARTASRAARCRCNAAAEAEGVKNHFRVEYQVVNLAKLAELYPQGGEVTKSDLVAKGAVRKNDWSRCSHRRDLGRDRRQGGRLLGLRQGEDRRGRRLPPRAVKQCSMAAPPSGGGRRAPSPSGTVPQSVRPSEYRFACRLCVRWREPRRCPAAPPFLQRDKPSFSNHRRRTVRWGSAGEQCSLHLPGRSGSPDLRKKLLFTLGIMALFRLGSHIPARAWTPPRSALCVRRRLHQRSRPDQPFSAARCCSPSSRRIMPTSPRRSSCSCDRGDPAWTASRRRGRPAGEDTQYTVI